MNLQAHKNWNPSEKLWYAKYHSRVELGPYTRYYKLNLSPSEESECKVRTRQTSNGSFTTIYTNNTKLLQRMMESYTRINKINTPINAAHEEVISDPNKIVEIRNSLYYKKYRMKVLITRNWAIRKSNDDWNTDAKIILSWLEMNFKDTKFRNQVGATQFFNTYFRQYIQIPYMYTNDDQSLMMLKLLYSNNWRIFISYAYTPQDFNPV